MCACVHACVCVFLSFLRCFSLDNYYFYLFLFLFIFSSQIFKNVHLITQAFGRPVVVDTLCDGEDVQIPLLTNSFFSLDSFTFVEVYIDVFYGLRWLRDGYI